MSSCPRSSISRGFVKKLRSLYRRLCDTAVATGKGGNGAGKTFGVVFAISCLARQASKTCTHSEQNQSVLGTAVKPTHRTWWDAVAAVAEQHLRWTLFLFFRGGRFARQLLHFPCTALGWNLKHGVGSKDGPGFQRSVPWAIERPYPSNRSPVLLAASASV